MNSKLNELKKNIFYEVMNIVGRVFIMVRYSEGVRIGTRGFLPEEKEGGLILVFNSQMNFTWDDSGITATLVFGTSPQKCFIPADNIIAVYSPELNSQFLAGPQILKEEAVRRMSERSAVEGEAKVVKVDFKRKK